MQNRKQEDEAVPLPEYCLQEVWVLFLMFVGYLGVCMLAFTALASLFG